MSLRSFRCLLMTVAVVLWAGQIRAQEADLAVHAVAYLEVAPAGRSAFERALGTYREASRKEPGFTAIDMLAQTARPGLFVVVESWADRAAFDAHTAAAARKALLAAFEGVRVSGYDERLYKTLTVAAATQVPGDAVYVVSHVDIGGQGTNAPAVLRTLADASRKEPGALRFDVYQHAMRANHFTVVEVWRSAQARDAHAAAAHTKQYRDTLLPLTGSPIDERLLSAVR